MSLCHLGAMALEHTEKESRRGEFFLAFSAWTLNSQNRSLTTSSFSCLSDIIYFNNPVLCVFPIVKKVNFSYLSDSGLLRVPLSPLGLFRKGLRLTLFWSGVFFVLIASLLCRGWCFTWATSSIVYFSFLAVVCMMVPSIVSHTSEAARNSGPAW